MKTYFALFLISTVASLIITPLIRRLCQRLNLLDVPSDERRIHKQGIPRLGGVAIFLSMLIALSALPFISNLLTQSLRARVPELFIVLVPTGLVLLLGVYDDLRGTNAVVKFLGLGLIAAVFYWMGGRIETFAIPFIGVIHFPQAIGLLITVFWLVGISNAFNLIDGMDGLAPGAALFSAIVLLIISLVNENPLTIVITLVLCGGLTGFLRYNFNPASIFLGDSGALSVGFLLAALSVVGVQKATTAVAVIVPIVAFGLPVVDTSVTMIRRLVGKRPLFEGDGEHIHHMLLARGWSQRRVAWILYGVCAAFGLLATVFTTTSPPLTGVVLFVASVVLVIGVGQLRYHEVDELRAGVRRTVGNRRLRVANNIRMRRAGVALAKAATLDDVFKALAQMLEFEEFAYANVRLGQAGRADAAEHAFSAVERSRPKEDVEFTQGQISWSWKHDGLDHEEVVGSSDYFCFQLPLRTEIGEWGWMSLYRPLGGPPLLLDVDYLSGFLRIELSKAAERVIDSFRETPTASKLSFTLSAGKIAG